MRFQGKFNFALLLVFAGLLLALYWNLFQADFLPWDDDYNISLNPIFQQGLWSEFWRKPFYGMYIPITSVAWGILFDLGQGSALPFRIFNFTLHLLNVFLVFQFLKAWMQRLNLNFRWVMPLALGFFALHPMQVESVAWISGGRDLLSTTLALVAMIVYFRLPNWKGFALGGVFFILALLSKPQVAALPLVVFLLEFILTPGRWKQTAGQMFIWTLPVLAVAALTFTEQKEYVAKTVTLFERPLVILDSFGFYLSKIFWPHPLAVDYGRTPEWLLARLENHWLSIALSVLSLLFFLFCLFKKKSRIFGLLFFAWMGALLPVSGVIDFAYQDISTTADHYMYFPMIVFSLFILVAAATFESWHQKILKCVCVAGLIAFSFLSWQRVQVWQDRDHFFSDMFEKNPNSYSALIGMGGNSAIHQDNAKALEYYQGALNLRPMDVAATANILASLFRLQRYEDVMKWEPFLLHENYIRTLKMRHIASANILSTFGSTAFMLKNLDLSFLYLCQAYAINPYNRGIEGAHAKILELERAKNPNAACPRFPTDEDFLQAVRISMSHR